jgi:mRNA-degrading endonuclease YafQ of YafQ-DinJ toxin-antitoxin module
MTSKKPAASKRASLPRACDHTNKDLLLIYTLDGSSKSGLVVFVRSGTHFELFS